MTDDIKETELDDETSVSAEPDFSPVAAAPLLDDDVADDDPHASFDPIAGHAAEDPYLDPYGVGAPKSTDEDYLDDDEEVDSFDSSDSEAY